VMINDNAALPEDVNPLLGYLGIRLVEWQPGRAEFAIDIEPRHLNRSGFLQGGVTATILDAACGYGGLWLDEHPVSGNAVTAMLSISYLAPAKQGTLTASGRVIKAGQKLCFASGELADANGTLIATAQGTFMRRPSEPSIA
jgi:uncharacterized protein (TIGR00369 family)